MSNIHSGGDPIEYETLQDVTLGDTVAVQVRPLNPPGGATPAPTTPPAGQSLNPPWYVFSGEVRETDDWAADGDQAGVSGDGKDLSERTALASISVDPQLLWKITSDGLRDNSQNVTTVPPIKSSSKTPDDAPPPCLLSYRPDQHTHLVVYEAHADRGEIWHVSRSIGSVVDAVYGASVEAEQVLPQGYDPPA